MKLVIIIEIWYKPLILRTAPLAQLVEHLICNKMSSGRKLAKKEEKQIRANQ